MGLFITELSNNFGYAITISLLDYIAEISLGVLCIIICFCFRLICQNKRLLNNTINISIGKNTSMSTNNAFMFDCVKCPSQFNGLRELRKHTCKSQNSKNDGESMTINERPKDNSEKENWREVDKSTKNVAVENNVNTLESYTIKEYIEGQFDISEEDQRPLDFKGKVQGTVVVERATNLDFVSQQSNKCKTCLRTFRDKTIFQKHISLCNGVWKMKNYRCHICEKKCSLKDNLKKSHENP